MSRRAVQVTGGTTAVNRAGVPFPVPVDKDMSTRKDARYEDEESHRPNRFRPTRAGRKPPRRWHGSERRFSLATTDRWTDGAGEKKERTEWHRVVFWDRPAQQLAKSLHAGSFVEVEEAMQRSAYEKGGITRTTWQVRGSTYRVLDRAGDEAEPPSAPCDPQPANDAVNTGDDIPL